MAVAARVTKSLAGRSDFIQQLRKATSTAVAEKMEGLKAEASAEFDRIISAEFVNDRSPDRRKTGRHLLGSSRVVVNWNGSDFPVSMTISSLAEAGKVNSLNSGSRAHPIPGPVSFYVDARFAKGGQTSAPRKGKKPAFKVAYTKNVRIRPTSVDAPALRAHHFLERTLENVMSAAFHKTVKVRRR